MSAEPVDEAQSLSVSARTIRRKDTTRESAPEQWRCSAAQGPRRPKGHDRLMLILHSCTDKTERISTEAGA